MLEQYLVVTTGVFNCCFFTVSIKFSYWVPTKGIAALQSVSLFCYSSVTFLRYCKISCRVTTE